MNCSYIKENLFAIAEKTLPPGELTAVEKHMESCCGCKAMVDFIRRSEQVIREQREAEPDPFLVTRTVAMLESRFLSFGRQKSVRHVHLLRPLLASVLFGLAIFTGILSGRYGYMKHDQALSVSETETLKSELALEEVVAEEPGLMMLEETGIIQDEIK